MKTTPSASDISEDLDKLRSAADLPAAKTAAVRAAAKIDELYAARRAELEIVRLNLDLTLEARDRLSNEIRAKYAEKAAAYQATLAEVDRQTTAVEPLVQRPDLHHFERVLMLEPSDLSPLLALAQRLPNDLLALASRSAVIAEKRSLASVLYLEARARDPKDRYVGESLKHLGSLPDEALAARTTISDIRAASSLPLAKAREMTGGAPVTSYDKIASGLARGEVVDLSAA